MGNACTVYGCVKGLWFEWHDSYGGSGEATREKQAEARRRSSAMRRTKRQLARSSMGAPSTASTLVFRPKSTRRGNGMHASASCARKRGHDWNACVVVSTAV